MKPQAYQKPTIYNSDGTKAQIGTYDIRSDPLTNSTADGILDYINNNLEALHSLYLPLSGGTMAGDIDMHGHNLIGGFSANTGIYCAGNDNGGFLGTTGANINIKSWYGVGFINGNPSFDTYNKVTVGVNVREGILYAHKLVATESIKAPRLEATEAIKAPNIYAKLEVDKKISDSMPTGTVLAFAGNTVPNNYLLCDGSAVSRSTYANLFKVIGTTYGAGNGSSTFNLPNLVDKFVEGSATAGTVKSAGLPNITGSMTPSYLRSNGTPTISGAFIGSTAGTAAAWGPSSQVSVNDIKINASKSNPIYGNSTTVQPPALTMRYIIKY